MKHVILFLIVIIVLSDQVLAQKASIYEKKVSMNTYMFSDPNPVPDMDKNYPYFRFDGYTNQSTQQEWNMVIMENDYIKVFIAPEIGGKIWGAIEKSTGGEFLYYNDAVKFRDVGLRGPWTSGGLEYNFGLMSHVSTCSTPQDYIIKENEDNSVSCVIGAIDLHTRTKWNVEVILPEDKAFIETKAFWSNSNPVPVTYYHYMNAAAKTAGNLEFLYPGTHHVGHGGDVGEWPVDKGRKISFYDNNNFGSYKSYHVLNTYTDFMGGYWHDDNFGFGHLGNYDDRPGKKIWIWGLSPQGEIWVDLLTDSKGQYIEFQSGKLFNQAMENSSLTPFKHREFFPYDTDVMSEIWFPIKGTGGMVSATKHAVMNAKREKDKIEIKLSALQHINSHLVIKSGTRVVKDEKIKMTPLELYELEINMDPNENYTVELGNNLLYYSSDEKDIVVNRPLQANKEYNWNSAMGLYTRGLELEKQQSYIDGHAYTMAHELYIQSLELDPAFAPALNRLALSYYRRMEYEKALEYVHKSLSIDTYDGEANYYYGLVNLKLNKIPDAKSGFSIAAQSTSHRTASYTELARLFLLEKKYPKASEYADKALKYNQYNTTALEISAIASRKMNDINSSNYSLDILYEYDETSSFVTYEEILRGKTDMISLQQLITNELPSESYLRLAIKYYNYGLPRESIEILRDSPRNATILYWLAYLDTEHQNEWLRQGLESSADFVFPFRDETFMVLNNMSILSDHWKIKYYKSLIYWKKGLIADAKELFRQCGKEPEYAPFYLAKAKLYDDNESIKNASIQKAVSLDANNWRGNMALINMLMIDEQYEQAAKLSKKALTGQPEMAKLGINYASSLLRLGAYEKCLKFLSSFELLPYEGAGEGRAIYHEACIRSAYRELEKKNYKKAIAHTEEAKLWPLNLGAGKSYIVDERLENFILAISYRNSGMNSEANSYFKKVINYSRSNQRRPGPSLYLVIASLEELERNDEAEYLLDSVKRDHPDNKFTKWLIAVKDGDGESILYEMKTSDQNSPTNNSFVLINDLIEILD